MPSVPHDFAASLKLAERDQDLKGNLVKLMGTSQILPPDHSDLVASTAKVMTWVIQSARSSYKAGPERLVGAISASSRQNALAVWSSSRLDWIIISHGLIELLRDRTDDLGERIAETFPEAMESRLIQRLVSKPPLSGGFRTTIGSFLYFAGISFFTGHEAAHHLCGHDGYFLQGAHAEKVDDSDESSDDWLTRHALEREADLVGVAVSSLATDEIADSTLGS